MKAIKYFLIFLTVGCSAQQWDSIKVAGNDVDSIMMAGVKIWEKPSEWDYEGVLTVGNDNVPGIYDAYGFSGYYSGGSFAYDYDGSVNPEHIISELSEFNFYFEWVDDTYESFTGLRVVADDGYSNVFSTSDDIYIEIDGSEFALIWNATLQYHTFSLATNPLPSVGNTANIKINYTLAP